jgi:hypothetical protein
MVRLRTVTPSLKACFAAFRGCRITELNRQKELEPRPVRCAGAKRERSCFPSFGRNGRIALISYMRTGENPIAAMMLHPRE